MKIQLERRPEAFPEIEPVPVAIRFASEPLDRRLRSNKKPKNLLFWFLIAAAILFLAMLIPQLYKNEIVLSTPPSTSR